MVTPIGFHPHNQKLEPLYLSPKTGEGEMFFFPQNRIVAFFGLLSPAFVCYGCFS